MTHALRVALRVAGCQPHVSANALKLFTLNADDQRAHMADTNLRKLEVEAHADTCTVMVLGALVNTTSAKPSTDEPEIVQEEAIPSDGKDVEGEEMMKSIRNEQLDVPAEPADER